MYEYVSVYNKNEMKMSADFWFTFPDFIFFLTDEMSLIILYKIFTKLHVFP